MTFDTFQQIVKSEAPAYADEYIQALWDGRPSDDMEEAALRVAIKLAVAGPYQGEVSRGPIR